MRGPMPIEIDYSSFQVVAILATYLLAAFVKGVTGLGFSTTCLPFLVVVVGLKEALPLLIIPSVSSNLMVMYRAGHFAETVRRFWPMLLATVPGLILGLWALSVVDGKQAGGALGFILLLWCAFSLAKPDIRLSTQLERKLGPVSGFLTGLVNGLTGSQVMPSVPFLLSLHLQRNVFVQAANCSFTLGSIVMAIGLERLGLFSSSAILISVSGTVVVFFGLKVGEAVRDTLSPERFRLMVLLMLIAMGLSLLYRALY